MVTVDEAMRKGQRLVNLPVLVFLIVGLFGFIYLDSKDIIPSPVALIGMMIIFLISWLYWSLMITKWRLWAFKQVDDPFELRRRAVAEKLIWPKGHIFEKTEIRTPVEKQEWKMILKTRFGEEETD